LKTEKPSLEVAPTTFLLTCNFQFNSSFQLLELELLFSISLSSKKERFPLVTSNFDLWPWPTNST